MNFSDLTCRVLFPACCLLGGLVSTCCLAQPAAAVATPAELAVELAPAGSHAVIYSDRSGGDVMHVALPGGGAVDYRFEGGRWRVEKTPDPVALADALPRAAAPLEKSRLGRLQLRAGSRNVSAGIVGQLSYDAAGNLYLANAEQLYRLDTHGRLELVLDAQLPPSALAALQQRKLAGSDGDRPKVFNTVSCMLRAPNGEVYVADDGIRQLRKFSPGGKVDMLSGTALPDLIDLNDPVGPAAGIKAHFNLPCHMALDRNGTLYLSDSQEESIWRLAPGGRPEQVLPLAGTLPLEPGQIAVDSRHNLYVADLKARAILKLDRQGRVSTVVAKGDADAAGSQRKLPVHLSLPSKWDVSLALGAGDRLYVADDNATMHIIAPDGSRRSWAWKNDAAARQGENGPGDDGEARRDWDWKDDFRHIVALLPDARGNVVINDGVGLYLWRLAPQAPAVGISPRDPPELVGCEGGPGFAAARELAVDAAGNAFLIEGLLSTTREVDSSGHAVAAGVQDMWASSTIGQDRGALHGLALDGEGRLYVADDRQHLVLRRETDGSVVTLPGGRPSPTVRGGSDGTRDRGEELEQRYKRAQADALAGKALFQTAQGLAVDGQGRIYLSDGVALHILRIDTDGTVKVLAGPRASVAGARPGLRDGPGEAARFARPARLALDAAGNLYVADDGAIRKITPEGMVTTLAGGRRNHALRSVDGDWPALHGYVDGPGANALFGELGGMSFDHHGNLLVMDKGNRVIRSIAPDGMVTSIAGHDRGAIMALDMADSSMGDADAVAVLPSGQLAVLTRGALLMTEKGGW